MAKIKGESAADALAAAGDTENTVDEPAPYIETEATIAEGRMTVPAEPPAEAE